MSFLRLNPKNWINTNEKAEGAPPLRLAPFLRWSLKGSYTALAVASLASISLGVIETHIAALIGDILDLFLTSTPDRLFSEEWLTLLTAAIFLLLVRPTSFFLSSYFQSFVINPGIRTMIATRMHRWVMGHPKSYFDNDFAGRIAQKEVQCSNAITDVVIETIHTVLFALATVATSFWIIASIDYGVGLIVFMWFAGFCFLMSYFLPRIKRSSAKRANAQAAATGQIVDTISNISIVKLFANIHHEDKAALNAFLSLKDTLQSYGRELIRFRASMVLYSGVVFVAVMGSCIFLWTKGVVTPGETIAASSVALRIMMMSGWVSFSLMSIYTNLGDVHDAIGTLAIPHTMVDKNGAKELQNVIGKIEFDKVSFTYGKNLGGLRSISLSIKAGEKLGVVGASGAGKSTLVSTLLRLHDPESGSIFIDNQNITDVTQNSLRKNIGIVAQETSMFNRSARDNIIYGRPNATEKEMIEAATKAGAHEFILDLTDSQNRKGYEAFLGERGVKLSGGQRQRIALARAIIKDAPILVLDEATSALDSEIEAAIQESLDVVMAGKTVFAIAHRLSTISQMDRIVVMSEGKIIEEGSHHTLLKKKGIYASFWERQSGGFLGVDAAA